MTSPDITPDTNYHLKQAVAVYFSLVLAPKFNANINFFAGEYLDQPEANFHTLIRGGDDSIHILTTNTDNKTGAVVHIDLAPPDGLPASIVRPGFYNKAGELASADQITVDAERRFKRLVVRPLSENEAVGLTLDLRSIMGKVPINWRKRELSAKESKKHNRT